MLRALLFSILIAVAGSSVAQFSGVGGAGSQRAGNWAAITSGKSVILASGTTSNAASDATVPCVTAPASICVDVIAFQVQWAACEPTSGTYQFGTCLSALSAAQAANSAIMFSVYVNTVLGVATPNWETCQRVGGLLSPLTNFNGSCVPTDSQYITDMQSFMSHLKTYLQANGTPTYYSKLWAVQSAPAQGEVILGGVSSGSNCTLGGASATQDTSSSFTIAAVGSTQTVAVTTGSAYIVGEYPVITDGTHTITGDITAIAGNNLTVKTILISAGSAGNTMASGASVTWTQWTYNRSTYLSTWEGMMDYYTTNYPSTHVWLTGPNNNEICGTISDSTFHSTLYTYATVTDGNTNVWNFSADGGTPVTGSIFGNWSTTLINVFETGGFTPVGGIELQANGAVTTSTGFNSAPIVRSMCGEYAEASNLGFTVAGWETYEADQLSHNRDVDLTIEGAHAAYAATICPGLY